MGTKLSTSSSESSIVVNVRGKKGEYFIGKLTAHRTAPSQYKKENGTNKDYHIYEFVLEDSDMTFQKKVGKEYVDQTPEAGVSVSVFAPTRLNNALQRAQNGQKIRIEYLGLGKAGKLGGKPHEYDVEVL